MTYKKSDKVMKHWDADIFANFLYSTYPKSPVKEQPESEILTDYKSSGFPQFQTPETIELNIQPIQESYKSSSHEKSSHKPDYEKRKPPFEATWAIWVEYLVVKYESKRLELLGLTKKAKKVESEFLKSDAFGYDILSFNDRRIRKIHRSKGNPSKAFKYN